MSELAIAIAIILFPGLISAVICDAITIHRPRWGNLKYSIYSFIFGVGCYLFVQCVWTTLSWFLHLLGCSAESNSTVLSVWAIVSPDSVKINLTEVFFATVAAPIVAGLSAYIVNHKIINSVATKFRISTKYGDENLFSFYLNAKETDWIYVRDKDAELTYEGRVISFSEGENIQELLLSDVRVYEYSSSEYLYEIPAVYLSKPLGSFVLESVPKKFLGENDEKNTTS